VNTKLRLIVFFAVIALLYYLAFQYWL